MLLIQLSPFAQSRTCIVFGNHVQTCTNLEFNILAVFIKTSEPLWGLRRSIFFFFTNDGSFKIKQKRTNHPLILCQVFQHLPSLQFVFNTTQRPLLSLKVPIPKEKRKGQL